VLKLQKRFLKLSNTSFIKGGFAKALFLRAAKFAV